MNGDPLEDGRQPWCSECGGVLYSVRGGYECRGCRLRFLPFVDEPTGRR